jgi:hypothetical protein
LRQLGFREKDARAAVAAGLRTLSEPVTPQSLLRAALAIATEGSLCSPVQTHSAAE